MLQMLGMFITATTLAPPSQTTTLATGDGLDEYLPYYAANVDGCEHLSEDSPGIPLDNIYAKYTVSEDFVDYLMFLPPGAGSQWAPLRLMKWGWEPTITQPRGGWQNWPAGQGTGNQPYYIPQSSDKGYPSWAYMIYMPHN